MSAIMVSLIIVVVGMFITTLSMRMIRVGTIGVLEVPCMIIVSVIGWWACS